MAHGRKVKLSESLKRHYNVFGVHEEDSVLLNFDLSHHPEWKNKGYNITIYDESDRSTLVSKGFSTDNFTLTIPDYSFGSIRAVAVIEDRSDPNNIDAIENIAYFVFKQLKGGVERTLEGHAEIEDSDGTVYTVPYYSTGFIIS